MLKIKDELKFIFFFVFQIISLFHFISNQESIENILYPSALKLFNQGIVMVASDGIHFFSADMREEVSKKINFETQIQSLEESEKTTIVQLPLKYGAYLMILVNDIIYFFAQDWNFIHSFNLTDSINGLHYSLIPYIKKDTYLYYLISYPIDKKSFDLVYFKFDLDSYTNEIIRKNTIYPEIKTSNVETLNLSGVNCIFMVHSSFSYELLVCFYAIFFPSEIQERTFDPKNDFIELTEYFDYRRVEEKHLDFPYFIYAVANEGKTEANIFISEYIPYQMKFDFINFLQKPTLLSDNFIIRKSYSHNKIYYFSQTQEYIFASYYLESCKIYEILLDSNFTKKNEGFIKPISNCYKANTFSIFYNGNNGNTYSLVIDDAEKNKTLINYNADLITSQIENQISEKLISSLDMELLSSNIEKNEAIIYNYSISIDFYNNFENINKTDKKDQDNIIMNIQSEILNHSLDHNISNMLEKNEDLIIRKNDIIFQITSTDNQKRNIYRNISTIDLGQCENILRNHYNISNKTSLIIFKIDVFENGLLIPIIEFQVYNPITKEKLDLYLCKNIKIKVSIPVSIDENNLFKYNISSNYYNDICFVYTTEKGTDIILKDRRNEFIYNNMSLCEDNCELIGYNSITKKAICNCEIKFNFRLFSEIFNNKNKLFNSF